MKCAIVTVYNSENSGSYLQAYALGEKIKQLGHTAVFVRQNFSDHGTSYIQYIKKIGRGICKCKISSIKLINTRRKAFKTAVSKFTLENPNKSIDNYILGSDTIWDISIKYFRNHRSFFWGTDFIGTKVISYAASLGFANADIIKNCDIVPQALNNIASISVRENSAREILQPYTEKKIEVVCDPTLLLQREEYEALAPQNNYKNCIFIYSYGKMPVEYAEEIQRFARTEGLKTIILGTGNEWCDFSLAYDPFLFLGIMKNAKYVITNTFHGTVFSHILEKKFAVIDCGKSKVTDFLIKHGTTDKSFRNAADIETILKSQYDYESINAIIQEERNAGTSFLKAAIEG